MYQRWFGRTGLGVVVKGSGRGGGPLAAGPGGKCVCPQCGVETDHATGQSCADVVCPECGAKMTRKAE